jgi:cell division septation protein DedD
MFMARDISGYIRELLFGHDCVIIPGFGAFIGNYFPSHIDRREGMFYPPSRKVTFNRHLTGNDGLLIGHISSHLGIGYGESRDMVIEWAEGLRKKILAGSQVNMEHLGTFSLNNEGAIIFDPDLSVNYLLSSYGLTAYHRHPVSGFDVRRRVLERRHEQPVSQPSVRRLLMRAAVIIPVLVALALVPFNDHIFKGRVDESTMNPLANAELEYNRKQIDATVNIAVPADKVTEEQTSATTASSGEQMEPAAAIVTGDMEAGRVTDENPVSREEAPVRLPEVVHEYRYLVIIGSFQGEENALTMVEKLRRRGFDPEVAGGPDGFLRVSAVSFDNIDDAKISLAKLRTDFPGAWVYRSR